MKYHEPVMAAEVKELLQVKKSGLYIDCTLGDGGHSIDILTLGGKVLALDISDDSIARAQNRISELGFSENFRVVKGNFKDLKKICEAQGISSVNGIIYDLGYSSTQLESENIGLSFLKDQTFEIIVVPLKRLLGQLR
jgi:16S rRNA (cytosine1402-N4)-methyltransferase